MKRILIIEDRPEDREKLLLEYREPGSIVDMSSSSLQSFYLLNKFDYDVVIVSNDLDDLNGIWIVNYIKERCDCEAILTSRTELPDIMKLLRKNGVKFVRK